MKEKNIGAHKTNLLLYMWLVAATIKVWYYDILQSLQLNLLIVSLFCKDYLHLHYYSWSVNRWKTVTDHEQMYSLKNKTSH